MTVARVSPLLSKTFNVGQTPPHSSSLSLALIVPVPLSRTIAFNHNRVFGSFDHAGVEGFDSWCVGSVSGLPEDSLSLLNDNLVFVYLLLLRKLVVTSA